VITTQVEETLHDPKDGGKNCIVAICIKREKRRGKRICQAKTSNKKIAGNKGQRKN